MKSKKVVQHKSPRADPGHGNFMDSEIRCQQRVHHYHLVKTSKLIILAHEVSNVLH
jgi:hypothetical protein